MNAFDKQIIQKLLAQDAAIGNIFNLFIRNVSPYISLYRKSLSSDIWAGNHEIRILIDRELEDLQNNLKTAISNNAKSAWKLSTEKNDELVSNYIKGMSISNVAKERMFQKNLVAFESFIKRKENGFTLSDRVWKIAQEARTQLDFYIESGIGIGRSAEKIGQDIRQLLNNPDKRFRRIRDPKTGKLKPSQPMKDYGPGRGVYRSARQNALRLSITETNMAYRSSDSERWNQLDFVVGYEIKLSQNHGSDDYDVCDEAAGQYPKWFVWNGWHPRCMCYRVPVLIPEDTYMDYIFSNEEGKKEIIERHSIKEVPGNFQTWVSDNKTKIAGWKSQPYWVKDNFKDNNIRNGLKFGALRPGVKPSKPTKLSSEAIIRKAESGIRNNSKETAIIFDQKGREIFRKGGDHSSVSFTPDEMTFFKDGILTHNHPSALNHPEGSMMRIGNSFSGSDIITSIRNNLSEVRAVTPTYTFIMKRPKSGWPDLSDSIDTYHRLHGDVFTELQSRLYTNTTTVNKASIITAHLVARRFAKYFNIKYIKFKGQ